MTNYTFTGSNQQPEQVKDTDLTHDSPHHTLGRGHTQAAPGNHTHKYTDIVGTPPEQDLTHNHDANYAAVDHGHSYAPVSHAHAYAPTSHTHGTLRYIIHDFGSLAGGAVVTYTTTRVSSELPISVYSRTGQLNYTWSFSFPNSTSFIVHIRNQSASTNAIGVCYIVVGTIG